MTESVRPTAMSPDDTVIERLAAIDWQMIGDALNHCGYALIEHLLAPGECAAMTALYVEDTRFRNHVVMERHGYGRGEYRYFSYPLPGLVNDLRTQAYPHLAPLADQLHAALGSEVRYPSHHAEFIARCHAAGQSKPTCLQLRYAADDYNCLHQDLYGAQVFPVQMAILLSDPERDFTGGEFIFTEQRPRRQSRAEVIPLRQGDAVIFAVHQRPVRGPRGSCRVNHRHGVSRVRSGHRHTLGIIFHDAL